MEHSTVSLFEQLAKEILNFYFKDFLSQDNIRPSWCHGLEIDRFYPQLGVAIEIQGSQHYKINLEMQSNERFQSQLRADSLKRNLCVSHGYSFFPLSIFDFTENSHKSTIDRVRMAGMIYCKKKKEEVLFNRLARMQIYKYPDTQIFRRLDGIRSRH